MSALVIRLVIGVLLIIHGFAHYRITTAWGNREAAEAPLLRALGASTATIQSLGNVLWIVALLAFIVAGLVLVFQPGWWVAPTVVAALISLAAIGLYWMPSAVAGAVVDLGTIVALLIVRWPTVEMLGAH